MQLKNLDIYSAAQLLPERKPFSHKGSFGKVLIICGSKNMVGCCVLATLGALRSGAGLVTVAFPDVIYSSITSQITEATFLPLPTDENGFISHLALSQILEKAETSDVVVVGCGIGVGYTQSLIITSLLDIEDKPIIIDADGLNCLSMAPEILKKTKANVLLTPHPGEMSRLTGIDVVDIEKDRISVITDFCKEYNVNVLLKGHETLLCDSNCTELYVNQTGNTGLSKGGSGDLLAGIIGGLTPSLNGDVFKSAVLGAFVHGLSADLLAEEMSEYSILPSDCAYNLGKVYLTIEKSGNN